MGELASKLMLQARIVAIVDDDESVRAALHSLLRSFGFAAAVYASAEDFLRSARIGETGCIIVDVRMPGMGGFDLHRGLLAEGLELPTIFISAHDEPAVRRRAYRSGAVAFLRKPFGERPLISAVRAALGVEAVEVTLEPLAK
jgi:FixJ family two-component response regulator